MIVVGRHVFFRAVLRWGAALAFCYPLKHRERFWLRAVELLLSLMALTWLPADANRRTKQSMLRAQINSTILQVLEETQGNKAETARRLGISPATLWRKLKAIATQEKK